MSTHNVCTCRDIRGEIRIYPKFYLKKNVLSVTIYQSETNVSDLCSQIKYLRFFDSVDFPTSLHERCF